MENRYWKLVAEDDGCTQRMRVPGAFYRTIVTRGSTLAVAMTFVPYRCGRGRGHKADDYYVAGDDGLSCPLRPSIQCNV